MWLYTGYYIKYSQLCYEFGIILVPCTGFPGGSYSKVSACNAGDLGSIPGSGRSPREVPTLVLLPRKFHGWRSLVGHSPWDRKESDMTEQLHLSLLQMRKLTFREVTYVNITYIHNIIYIHKDPLT